MRSTGVCFQLTSRPVGRSKSAGSYERGRSERVWIGAQAPSVWPFEPGTVEPGTGEGACVVVVI